MVGFEEGTEIKDILLDTVEGGISGLAGRYIYDKIIGQPLLTALKPIGKYADVVGAFLFATVLNYAGTKVESDKFGMGLKVAGYVPLADTLGKLIGDATPMSKVSMSKGINWGSLSPVNLEEVKM